MSGSNPSMRLSKRSRASDAAQDRLIRTEGERVKRRRTSHDKDEIKQSLGPAMPHAPKEKNDHNQTVHVANSSSLHSIDQDTIAVPEAWSLSTPVAGQYTNIDPILTRDEGYLFVGLEAAVHVYSVATSRLFRTLQLKPNQSIIGYNLSSASQEYLYIVTSAGSVSKWDWLSGKQVSHWTMGRKIISVSPSFSANQGEEDFALLILRDHKAGKREIVVAHLSEKNLHETVILETSARLDHIKCISDGQAVIAYSGQRVLIGTQGLSQNDPELMQYTWKEVALPVNISCVDIRHSTASSRVEGQSWNNKKGPIGIDLALGSSDGSILIYHDILNFVGKEHHKGEKTMTPRRLHWHRDLVTVVRWSIDGNYVISGGHESVMVLWQLDTGRKQFLPHLSSPICNIVVSSTGNSYAIKLADNSIIVLSARELQPFATITGLQSYSQINKPRVGVYPPPTPAAAILHPQYGERLLITVPASRQVTHEGHHPANSCVLQTYDIHSNSHISRQALARTNATTLKISPEGLPIAAPNVTHLDVSHDGKWMSTVDTWSPNPHDTEALDCNSTGMRSIAADYQEVFLKFWRWSKSGLWELVTRVDGPHFSGKGPVPVLDLASRPVSDEFATIGSNAVLRLWCPSSRQRSGLKTGHGEEQLETWKCRNTVDLKGYINGENLDSVNMASIAFSQDGSVLAVCLQSGYPGSPGIAVLVDVQSCTVRYSRAGVYPGDPCVARFLGCHLVIASTQSVSVWDTVDDIVRTPGNLEVGYSHDDKAYRLLAVDLNTQTFAVTVQRPQSPTAPRKGCKYFVQVYDVQSLSLLSQLPLGRSPHALLPDSRSGDYIVLDVAANVQRLGCSKKTSQALPSQDWVDKVNSGLAELLGSSVYGSRYQQPSQTLMDSFEASPPQSKELAGIFNDSPFVLPSASVLFQDVVQALTG
ncbi:quinon protein alcohol dehydrogenase-like superfamily [Aspergillus caelatus]|uniref:Quinon protein alcohol dehydrogenase-like superfamily n=1 Tax=Aspergillus caelatus TaxID=61420 RepID=A0A5N7A375_9EURO|nr:quinon protein alcohol dehydrogenase-like superfamily [Aspergillus caelatus]KAE8363639.1 quinon protein alcohol dehydrogenase-like superfamily [Aspergillus caelatus]